VGFQNGGTIGAIILPNLIPEWDEITLLSVNFVPNVGRKYLPTADVTNTTTGMR